MSIKKALVRRAWSALNTAAGMAGFGISSYRHPVRVSDLRNIQRLRAQRETLITPLEAHQLISAVRATAKLGGAMAEIGVFRGASAKLIRETDSARPLHLFDTFEGLPETSKSDVEFRAGQFEKGDLACSLEDVRNYLGTGANLFFHKGMFPDTGAAVENERFSFVHSDVDLYASACSVLSFFYPRLVRGGVLITHDFATCPGPRKAFTDFFADKPDVLVELAGDQAIVVKL